MEETRDYMEEFIGILTSEPDRAYDFICNHYWEMDKMDLADIIKELLYQVYIQCTETKHNDILFGVATELSEARS